jgi:hypothetical protein
MEQVAWSEEKIKDKRHKLRSATTKSRFGGNKSVEELKGLNELNDKRQKIKVKR